MWTQRWEFGILNNLHPPSFFSWSTEAKPLWTFVFSVCNPRQKTSLFGDLGCFFFFFFFLLEGYRKHAEAKYTGIMNSCFVIEKGNTIFAVFFSCGDNPKSSETDQQHFRRQIGQTQKQDIFIRKGRAHQVFSGFSSTTGGGSKLSHELFASFCFSP